MNKLRIKLLVTVALASSLFSAKALDWAPDGDAVDESSGITQFATTGAAYSGGDIISADEGGSSNCSFSANAAETDADNTVDIYGTIDQTADGTQCPLKLNGDINLSAVDANLTVNINTPVTIEPYRSSIAPNEDTEQADGSLLIFETAAGKKITVNVDYDLQFRGITDDVTTGDEAGFSDLFIAFKGDGQTIFKMADGTAIKFDGQADESAPAELDDTTGLIVPRDVGDYSANAGGTKVFVLMDQTAAQVNAGQNKVLFERKNDGDASLRTMIYVGPNSVFTYLSDNYQGLATPTADDIPAEGKYYAAVGIDPSNPAGTGRMVLFIKGAYKTGWQTGDYSSGENADPLFLQMVAKYPFNDGSVVIAGHSVTDFEDPANFRTAIDSSDSSSTGFDFSSPAGVKAIFRVVDNNAYTAATKPFAPTAAQRRGLLVINDCQNLGKYAADPYWDFYSGNDAVGPTWAYFNNPAKNVRLGFVLGVNGALDIYDSTFLDYAGGASNDLDYLAAIDFDGSCLKKHNPSALIVDGIDASLYSIADLEYPFTAANADPVNGLGAAAVVPQIILRGNAKIKFKNAAVSTSAYTTESDASTGFGPGYLFNFWVQDPLDPEAIDPIADSTIDFDKSLAVGQVTDGVLQRAGYNGYQLENLVNDITDVPYTKTGEGEITLDVEGPLKVETISNNSIYADAYATTLAARNNFAEAAVQSGVITFDSILTGVDGREINYTDDTTVTTEVITRPLLNGSSDKYARYNSPGLFINHRISLYNTLFAHTDASKLVNGNPGSSEPFITGGERYYFSWEQFSDDASLAADQDRYRYPEFRLFNSELALHESLCASGARIVVMDDPGHPFNAPAEPDYSGSNLSVIRFYDHGFDLDPASGRILMLGSDLNLMEDVVPGPNYGTRSAFINVFKRNVPQGLSDTTDLSSTVKLSLRNGNEFPATVLPANYDRSRALHYIWMGIPDSAMAYTNTGIFVGWPTVGDIDDSGTSFPIADSRSYPYPDEVQNTEDKETYWFKLDALSTADGLPAKQAELSIDGNFICFNSTDSSDNGPVVPVKDAKDAGNVFVDFGGKLSISKSAVDSRAISTLNTSFFNVSVPFKTWNDFDYDGINRLTWYSGYVELPIVQARFGDAYGIQPYGLTKDMFAANTEAQGYLRLPVEDEATIAWFYRDTLLGSLEKSRVAIKRPDYLMYVGSGSDVDQLRVSGAKASDPLLFDISGDGSRPKTARVREFATLKSTRAQKIIGEGQHGIIFAEYGGRFGLGSTEWNANSTNAWNILGEDYVSIAPLGNCTIDVNEDVIIADDLPFMATKRYSATSTAFGDFSDSEIAADPDKKLSHRMTIRSETEREIRVVAGTILDLSGFGQGNRRQEIAFGGKIKLVIEQGGGIRFPTPGTTAEEAAKGGVVLYFNDESQLVFEGINDITGARYLSAVESDDNRIKLLGKGQIWFNKSAKLNVLGTASVGVQADLDTLSTDITISLQRQSQFNIGDATLAGGVFQVGNPAAVAGSTINFSLLINGADALFHTDREGFFGLGAGIVNKPSSKPNGDATADVNPQIDPETQKAGISTDTDLPIFSADASPTPQLEDHSEFFGGNAWQVIPLFNVNNITIQLQNGIIEHKNIFDGSDTNASLWAVGPFAGTATFNLNGGASAIVRGGGNIMAVPATLSLDYSFIPVNIWDYAGVMGDTGEQYSIFASAPLLLARAATAATDFTTATLTGFQQGNSFAFTSPADFYKFLAFKDFSTQGGARYVTVGTTQFTTRAGYVNKDFTNAKYPVDMLKIVRLDNPNCINGKASTAITGVLTSQDAGNVDPQVLAIVQ